MRVASLIAVLVALLCGLAACGGSDDDSTSGAGTATGESPVPAQEVAADGDWAALKRSAGSNADRLIIPEGPVPDQVVIKDLKVGKGPAIAPGDTFFSYYVSFEYEDEDLLEPLPGEGTGKTPWVNAGSLIWGTGERVPGWEPGLKGIRAGGIRELIIPSDMAYENGARVYLVKVTKIEPQ